MSNKTEMQRVYKQMEALRKPRAKRPIAEKLAIAEELRDLQKALAPVREANRAKVRGSRRRNSS